jgi:hypothetical protein
MAGREVKAYACALAGTVISERIRLSMAGRKVSGPCTYALAGTVISELTDWPCLDVANSTTW